MRAKRIKKWQWVTGILTVSALLIIFFHREIGDGLMAAYRVLSDRDQANRFLSALGRGAPLAFMALQILQVIIAPVPGEATGFIGGYIFGAVKGFFYSSLALALGSWINFAIGRYFGNRFVRGWIPADKLERFDALVKRQGIIVLLILFIFPGFPKDYLCLFLGATAIPWKAFVLIASIGRMPGTLMLSLQGEFLFQRNYTVFAIILGVTVLAALLSIRYRERIYKWMDRLNGET